MNKKVNIAIIIISAILTILLAGVIFNSYVKNKKPKEEENVVKVDDAIDKYGYELIETSTTYYKELFNKLKILLNTEGFEEVEYAKLIAEMFAADFYDLDNKVSNSDIGGVDFVLKENRSNFKLAAQNSIYNSVQNNIYGDRNQKLPKVSKVDIESINTISHSYNGKTDNNAYSVVVNINYEEDLGYPKKTTLILVHSEEKLEIAKVG